MERSIFSVYDQEERYADRLKAIADSDKLPKLKEADVKAIRCLVEEVERLRSLLLIIKEMRRNQIERDKFQARGVSKEQGLEQAIHRAGQSQSVVDLKLSSELGE